MKTNNRKAKGMSIRIQFSLIFIGIMAGVVLLCLLFDALFLTKLYENSKIQAIENAYYTLLNSSESGDYDSEDFQDSLDEISRVNNIAIVLVKEDSEPIYISMMAERDMEYRLFSYILDIDFEFDNNIVEVIEKNDDYTIRRMGGKNGEFIEMVGRLDDGASFLMRIPCENIREGADFANKIFMIIGIVGIIGGALITWVLTGKLTKPILELNNISERMVDLDFDAKYTGKNTNEIGLLGENINHLSDSLEKSISELKTANLELKKDIEYKEQLDEMRQEFIANVSHELKTPIALIQGYTEGLSEGISDDPESRAYYCEVIMDEAGKMNNMVKKFLTLNQLEFGAADIQMERFDITAMIKNYLDSAALLADQNQIDIRFAEEKSISVWGDEYKAEEVFTNYFSNAIHHCAPDSNGEKYIKVYFEDEGESLRINVMNTGSNIPEESLERLWEKFYKVDKARTREYGGSGVGLSIVKATQEAVGQGYGVVNVPEGVVFWFDIALR